MLLQWGYYRQKRGWAQGRCTWMRGTAPTTVMVRTPMTAAAVMVPTTASSGGSANNRSRGSCGSSNEGSCSSNSNSGYGSSSEGGCSCRGSTSSSAPPTTAAAVLTTATAVADHPPYSISFKTASSVLVFEINTRCMNVSDTLKFEQEGEMVVLDVRVYPWRCKLLLEHQFLLCIIVHKNQLKLMGLVHAMWSNGPLSQVLLGWIDKSTLTTTQVFGAARIYTKSVSEKIMNMSEGVHWNQWSNSTKASQETVNIV